MAFKVLIVDDIPDTVMMLADVMKHAGYETVSASRGQQALALAEEVRPDVILLDVMMPDMDGIETCRRLRMNPTTADIPVILVSARSPTEARAEGLMAGATDYVTKPLHFADLLERVGRLVGPPSAFPPDPMRLLEEMVYTTLTVLPCDLAWLLAVDTDSHWLVHQAIGMVGGAEAAGEFLKKMGLDQPDVHLPLISGSTPLADAVLSRTVMLDIPAAKFSESVGGRVFSEVFEHFGFVHISLLPLITTNEMVGVLVLATTEHAIVDSERAQQILNSLCSQASMVVKNARLLNNLATREAQMKAEQSFRQMVLDTMGEGLVVVDDEAKIIYVNNRLLLITGYSRKDLYGQSVGKIFHPDQSAQLIGSLTQQRRGTQPFDQSLYTRGGRTIPVLLSRAVAPTPNGQGQITVMVVSDLSELHSNRDALQLQTQRLQSINRAITAISAASTFQDVVNVSAEAAREVVHGQAATLFLVADEETKELCEIATVGPRFDIEARTQMHRCVAWGDDLIGWVAQTSQSQLVTDIAQDAQIEALYKTIYGHSMRSMLLVPVVALDNVIGVLEVVTTQDYVFTTQDLATLESLAGSAAIAIENARLFDQTRRRVIELSMLLDASAAVTTTLDFGSILEQIAERLSVAIKVERVMIMDWYRRSKRLEPLAEVVRCYWQPGVGPVLNPNEHWVTEAAFKRATVIAADDDSLTAGETNASGLHATAAFPITRHGSIAGIITLYGKAPGSSWLPEKILSLTEEVKAEITQWEMNLASKGDWRTASALEDACERVLKTGKMRWCSVSYWDESVAAFRLLYEMGRVLWVNQASQLRDTDLYPSLANSLETGQIITLTRETTPVFDTPEQAFLRRVGGHTCLIVPLHLRGESSGLVTLIDSKQEPRVFDQAEISLCQGIANILGNAMENAKLYNIQEQRASALEAAYQQLRQADQIKNDLLQNLSHELRTPLTHILGYLRLMQDGTFGDFTTEQQEIVDLVTSKSQQIADIVEDIVVVQEPDAHHLAPRPIHLDQVIALAIQAMGPQATIQGIRIVPHLPPNLPQAYADPDRIGDVVKELLDNAIKFSPRGSEIEVTLEDPGGAIMRVCVRDQGIGIPTDEHDKIFHRFYQVDSGTTRRFGGTGLGLAVVRQIMVGHNGRVWVESEPERGSCFYLTLPKASALTLDV